MEEKITKELMEKAKEAKSPEEIIALAKENGIEITDEMAKGYFAQQQKAGELSDDELDNVSGGSCYHGKELVTTHVYWCSSYEVRNEKDRSQISTCTTCKYWEPVPSMLYGVCKNPVNARQ